METTGTSLAARVAEQYCSLLQVEAVALAGSQTNSVADTGSDIDLYVYSAEALPMSERRRTALLFSRHPEVGNCFWEPGDEWIDEQTGIQVDVMFRDTTWIQEQLARVLDEHQATVGYSTCFWHNVLSSRVLYDRNGWFAALQTKAREPYPDELQRAVIAKNFPILRQSLSAYLHQLERAVERSDRVSLNHRVAALLASYFDVLFAINRMPHPGEKRLVQIAEARCKRVPAAMRQQVEQLLEAAAAPSAEVLRFAEWLIDGLEALLHAEGLSFLA